MNIFCGYINALFFQYERTLRIFFPRLDGMAKNSENFPKSWMEKLTLRFFSVSESQTGKMQQAIPQSRIKRGTGLLRLCTFTEKKPKATFLRLRMWSTTTLFSRESDKNAAEEEENPVWARCLKITEKVSFNLASEASYVYILNGQKLIKNGPFWRVFENLKLAVNQCYQTGQF